MTLSIPSIESLPGFKKIEILDQTGSETLHFKVSGDRAFAGLAAEKLVNYVLASQLDGEQVYLPFGGQISSFFDEGYVAVKCFIRKAG